MSRLPPPFSGCPPLLGVVVVVIVYFSAPLFPFLPLRPPATHTATLASYAHASCPRWASLVGTVWSVLTLAAAVVAERDALFLAVVAAGFLFCGQVASPGPDWWTVKGPLPAPEGHQMGW